MSKREGDLWVLLDHTVAQGMQEKHLLKPHQKLLYSKDFKGVYDFCVTDKPIIERDINTTE
jgi:hypothetical protein